MVSFAMTTLLHSCLTKGIRAAGDQLKFGPNWIFSRRARLKLYDDHLECGDWSVPYDDIEQATLSAFRAGLFVTGYVLRVVTPEQTYHFGLNAGRYWQGELPFVVERTRARLRYSLLSLTSRLILFGCALYLLWNWFWAPGS